ncbi:MAG TPA: hypothetical protein PKD90_17110, partial [Phnomibacter sp.]|nr:hypothetical protein [Phnomibacter sp.]
FVKVAEALHIQNTNIYQYHGEGGHLTIEDVANRQTDVKVAYCNIAGNLNTNISTQVTNAETVVLATQMDGDLAVTTHHTEGNFYIGSTDNDEVSIGRHLILNTQTADYPKLQNIIFRGYEQSNISQAGPASVVIEKLRTEKNDPHSYIVPQTNLYISGEMQFGSGIIKPNHPHKVIFTSTSFISGMSSSSWVQGRVRKEGNNQFRFPVGGNSRQAPIDKTATPNDVYRAFEAEFFEEDPTVAGFDTAQRQSSLLKVSGVEYWELKQVEGPANNDYKVTLQYDTLRSQKAEAIYALRVATWHNNEWKNLGSTLVEAYGTEAFIQTPANAGQYQLFSFGYAAVRLPVVTVGTLPDSVCRNIPLKIPLVLDTLMEGGNTFEVHLSQSNGSFDSYLKIGEKSGVTNSDSILCVIPNATAAGTGYKIRIVGKWPQLLSVNTQSVTVITIPVQTPVIAGPLKVCLQSGVAKYY